MAENLELIHAGLPWNNPLKITVKADEYISLLVINRGLLNLLSNDYYLDLKTLRINQYLLLSLGPHINDSTIHFTEDLILDLIQKFLNGEMGSYVEGFGLSNNTAFIIPIDPNEDGYRNSTRIQNIINQCPKNLNGKVAIFAFTPIVEEVGNYYTNITDFIRSRKEDPENYINNIFTEEVKLDIKTNNITFNSFYGGTIIVLGNNYFVCDSTVKKQGQALNVKESRYLLELIQKDISEKEGTTLLTRQKNITLQGNCKNNNCSVISFMNCQCDTFLWNLAVLMYVSLISSTDDIIQLPSKDIVSLFFPANGENDKITDSSKYIVAAAINNEEFSSNYISLKTRYQEISLVEENDISFISLNKDCFNTDLISDSLRKILFGRYLDDNGEEQVINYYTGGSISFWMRGNFYDENITNVPILYSKDTNENGFYIGLEKVASIQDGNEDLTQYLETSYASKKRDDLNGKWLFWTINIIPVDIDARLYQILIWYADEKKNINRVLPSNIINTDENNKALAYNNIITLPSLNFGGNINLFGNALNRYNAQIRNILFCNQPLENDNQFKFIQNFAGLGIIDNYNLDFLVSDATFNNGMKGTLYVYNTTAMNILGCKFAKITKL